MKISRKGAAADHGIRSTSASIASAKWRDGSEVLRVKSDKPMTDFTGSSRHYYYVDLEIEEVGEIFSALAENARDLDRAVLDKLRPFVPDLIHLVNIASSR